MTSQGMGQCPSQHRRDHVNRKIVIVWDDVKAYHIELKDGGQVNVHAPIGANTSTESMNEVGLTVPKDNNKRNDWSMNDGAVDSNNCNYPLCTVVSSLFENSAYLSVKSENIVLGR